MYGQGRKDATTHTHVCAAPGTTPSYKQSTEDARKLLTGNADISATATYTLAVEAAPTTSTNKHCC